MVEFEDGQPIIRQGEEGDAFYIVKSGKVECTKFDVANNRMHILVTLSRGDHFG